MGRDINNSRIIDKSWKELFDKYKILDGVEKNGSFIIKSSQINEFKEARLMTKFDHKDNLPDLFYDNHLSILPITRGSYVIGKFDAYKKVNYNPKIETKRIQFPSWLETVDYNNLYSEASVINCAFATGIINDVLEDELILPTVSGRMSTSIFDFNIKSSIDNQYKTLNVINSQCEIDGGFESTSKFMIIEAKNTLAKDFLIRQLYYPYRLWKIKITKEVIPVFLTYSNDIFSFFIYKFENPNDYNSLVLEKQKNYIIDEETINLAEIKDVLDRVKIVKEPERPFPQADKIERVIDLLGLLMERDLTIEEITTNYAFNQRQAQYYSRAGMYLGLIEDKDKGAVSLTTLGKTIMSKRSKQKYLSIAECILQHKIFNEVLNLYFKKLAPPTTDETYQIMCKNIVRGVNSDNTRRRRAQSVNQWIKWILSLQNE